MHSRYKRQRICMFVWMDYKPLHVVRGELRANHIHKLLQKYKEMRSIEEDLVQPNREGDEVCESTH